MSRNATQALTDIILDAYLNPTLERLCADPMVGEIPVTLPECARYWVMSVIEAAEPINPEAYPVTATSLDCAIELADWSAIGNALHRGVEDYLDAERKAAFVEPDTITPWRVVA